MKTIEIVQPRSGPRPAPTRREQTPSALRHRITPLLLILTLLFVGILTMLVSMILGLIHFHEDMNRLFPESVSVRVNLVSEPASRI